MTHPIDIPHTPPALSFIEQLEADALAEELAAKKLELSEGEQRTAAAVARLQKAREEKAAAEKTRRGIDLATRERAARSIAGTRYLVKGVDLVDLFPLGAAPDVSQLPGGGVIIVRSPEPARLKSFHTEVEHKARPVADIYGDLLCESVVDPNPQDPAHGAKLRAFIDAYPGAAIGAGDHVAKLGGSKSAADKRGRA